MLYPTPQQELHPAVRWRCQNLPEDLGGVWGCRGRQGELQVFPFSYLSPGRQAGLGTSIQDTTEKIAKFGLQHGGLGETDKEKGKKELRKRPLFFSERRRAGSCGAGLSDSSLGSSRRAHLHCLPGLYTRQTQQQPSSVPFKNVCSDALQSHPSGIPCFDPLLTQELTLNCSICRWGSKARNFQTQKEEELLSPPKKIEGEKNNQTHCWQQFSRAVN